MTRPEPSAPPETKRTYLLAPYGGERVPGPEWFEAAIAAPVETGKVTVSGAQITYQCWGTRGRPGILLVHGSNAHLHWWDHIAPLLASDFRVAALSLSGMGESDWREGYSDGLYAQELLAVSEEAGLFAQGAPFVVAHSFGGLALAALVGQQAGSRFAGGIFLDTGVGLTREHSLPPSKFRRHIYQSQNEALGRFRLMPPQPHFEPWIVDHIARHSLVQKAGGWTWAFDPDLWGKMSRERTGHALHPTCPIAFMWGENSALLTPDRVAAQKVWAPPGSPFIRIPGSGHHLMVDQPLALVAALRDLLLTWPGLRDK